MNYTHKSSRLVSKGEHAWAQGKRIGLALDAVCLFIVAYLCYLNAPLLCLTLAYAAAKSPSEAWLPALIAGIGSVIFLLGRAASVRLHAAVTLDAGIPLTRAATADLPVNQCLVRSSIEPMQAQQAVLLRAGAAAQPRYEEQLVRATVGGAAAE